MDWLVENSKLIGLLFFFSVFIFIIVYAMWPGKRTQKEMHDHAEIPLKDNDTIKGGY